MLSTSAGGPVSVGAPIHDTAVLSGGDGPTGSITFQLFGPGDPSCANAAIFTSTDAVAGDGTYPSADFSPSHSGLYQWTASYGGDANNVEVPAACPAAGESSVVLVGAPEVAAQAPSAVTLGVPLTDSAVVSGGSRPTGNLQFTLFGPGDPTCSGTPLFTSPAVTVAGDGTYTSAAYVPTAPGSYQFAVAYSGDADNLASSVPCAVTSQASIVSPAVVMLSSQPPIPTSVGSAIVGKYVIALGTHPSGTIVFTIYGPNDPTCGKRPAFVSPPIMVMGDDTYAASPFTPDVPGSYNIVAAYSGDANNAPSVTPCGAAGDTVSISRAIVTIAARTSLQAFVGQAVSTAESISGGLHPGGTVTFAFYNPDDSTCTSTPALVSPRLRVTGDGTYQSPSFIPTTVGDYRFIVTYSGDADNIPLTTDCNGINQALLVSTSGLYDPIQHPHAVINLEVVAFALLALAGPAASSGAALRGAASPSPNRSAPQQTRSQGSVVGTGVDNTAEGWEAVAVLSEEALAELGKNTGDLSRSWHWPGTRRLDTLSIKVPKKVAPASPLVARVTNDAGYLRAMFGSAYVALPITGIVLATVAVSAVHGQALPPPLWLAVALAAVGVLDAFAGMLAVAVFVLGIIAHGGLATTDDARTLLGLSTLWFAAPIIAGVARPLRRAATKETPEHVERAADVVVAALAGAWAVKEIIEGLPGLSGKALPIAAHADAAAFAVLAALGLRMVFETTAAHHYPARLAEVQAEELPESGRAQHVTAALLALAVFLFVAIPYVGPCWELYLGGAFFAVPILMKLFNEHLPNVPKLYAVLPRGILGTVFMLAVGTVFGALVAAQLSSANHLVVIRESFVLLSLPGLVIAILQQFGRDGPEAPKIHWVPEKILGAAVVTLGALLAIGVIKV